MANWKKKIVAVASGCLIIGSLLIGVGVLAGGIQDVKQAYEAAKGELYQYPLTLESLEELEINLLDTPVAVEIGDVAKPELTYYKKEGDTPFSVEEDVTKRKLILSDATSTSEKIVFYTDIISAYANLTNNQNNLDRIMLRLPKGTNLARLNVSSTDNILFLKELEVEDFTIEANNAIISLDGLKVHKGQVSQIDGELYWINSRVSDTVIELTNSVLTVEGDSLVGSSINATDSSVSLDGLVENLAVTSQGGSLDIAKVDFRGTIDLESTDGPVSFQAFNTIQNRSLDVEVGDGSMFYNGEELSEKHEGYQSLKDRKHFSKTVGESLARIRVRVQGSDVYLNTNSVKIGE
ncbi:hypothetical protein ABID29_000228 [Streptococcus rupicaprae]|uniref:DUF4097 domain-containing protein n=1 Tax=Streptococcus rupicaprae TaxID=759619 RepID=A0ABV2FEY7_9STRE